MLVPELVVSSSVLARENDKEPNKRWKDLRLLSVLSHVAVNLSVEYIEKLADVNLHASHDEDGWQVLKRNLISSRVVLGGFSCGMIETALSWLDHGIQKILVLAGSLEDDELEKLAVECSQLPRSRVWVRVPVEISDLVLVDEEGNLVKNVRQIHSLQKQLTKLENVFGGFVLALNNSKTSNSPFVAKASITRAEELELIVEAVQEIRQQVGETVAFAIEWTHAKQEAFDRKVLLGHIAQLHRFGVDVLAPAATQVDDQQRNRLVDASQAFVRCLRSDRPDGLFTTVVADESGVALGLVYSSEESILESIRSGRGVYYSRSRKGLWKKGESSGHTQTLIQFDVDCDSDALRVTVKQHGSGFCHLNTRTCWGESGGLVALQDMLESRLQDAPAGSYTKRLFKDPQLLRNKLVEEAQELSEAQSQTHVAEEAADVLYFAMVRCVAAGVSIHDVEQQLDRRALKVKRRPGNAKAYRINAAEEILNKKPKH